MGIYNWGLGEVYMCTNKTISDKKMRKIKRGDGSEAGRASGMGDEKDGGLLENPELKDE